MNGISAFIKEETKKKKRESESARAVTFHYGQS